MPADLQTLTWVGAVLVALVADGGGVAGREGGLVGGVGGSLSA